MSVWLLICIGVSVQINSRILVLASTGQGNLQKNPPVRRHSELQLCEFGHAKEDHETVWAFVRLGRMWDSDRIGIQQP
jgi:hypothetical protein